jgi:hypothetical protein
MRARLIIALALALFVTSCEGDGAPSSTSTTRPATPVETGMSVPADVAEGMRSLDSVLEPAPHDAPQLAKVSLVDAVAAAGVGERNPAVVAFALFSDSERRGRLVYVLVFEGLTLYPSGGGYHPGEPDEVASSARIHHELVVLVDAITGEFISSTTFR